MNLENISVVIPIKEESKNLEELLNNLKYFGFNDIHVIDSLTTPKNIDLCKNANAFYTVFIWDGKFPKKRNWYLQNAILRDWVMFLDSDERLTPAFHSELLEISESCFDAYYVKYNNTFLGRKLKYGDVMTKIPIFRSHIRFEKIEEFEWSSFDMEVHEHPILDKSRIGTLKNRIEHLERTNIEKYLTKHNQYSNWESKRLAGNKILKDSRMRVKLKYWLLKSPWASVVYFIYAYFMKLGFLDGLPGYYLARLKAQYFLWIKLKYKYETRIP